MAGNVVKVIYPSYKIKDDIILSSPNLIDTNYYAKNTITAGSQNNTVNIAVNNVLFKSENKITLSQGFTAPAGKSFTAQIGEINDPEAITITYLYDHYGRLTSIGNNDFNNYYAEYQYDLNGQMTQEKLKPGSNQALVNYAYKISGQLASINANNNLFSETLMYEPNGNIMQLSYGNEYNYAFSYNRLGRLISANHSEDNRYDYSNMSYDANGNLLSLTKGIENKYYQYYSGTDRVKNTIGNPNDNDYQYDVNGNMVNSSPRQMILNYDQYFSKTSGITIGANQQVNFMYNSAGERVLKQANLQNQIYKTVYLRGNGNYPMTEVNESGNIKYFIYSPTGLICKIENNMEYYVIKDHLGSTRKLISNGAVSSSFAYDAYGNLMNSTISEDISYQYTGQEFDEETGLHNFRARLYDSELMRFYAVDPQWQTSSPYLFCGNSPVMYTDSDGEFFWIPAIIGGLAAYNGVRTAQATGNPFDFLVGFNSTVIQAGAAVVGSAVTGGLLIKYNFSALVQSKYILSIVSTAISSSAISTIFTEETTTGIGPYSYNWKSGKGQFANPFDDDNFICNMLEYMSYLQIYAEMYKHFGKFEGAISADAADKFTDLNKLTPKGDVYDDFVFSKIEESNLPDENEWFTKGNLFTKLAEKCTFGDNTDAKRGFQGWHFVKNGDWVVHNDFFNASNVNAIAHWHESIPFMIDSYISPSQITYQLFREIYLYNSLYHQFKWRR